MLGSDTMLSRGAANRIDIASGDSINIVSGDLLVGGVVALNNLTLKRDLSIEALDDLFFSLGPSNLTSYKGLLIK